MSLSSAFKAEGSTIGFQRRRVHYWFSNGESTFKITFIYIVPCCNGEKVVVPTIALYLTLLKLISQPHIDLENVLKIINTELIIILSVGLIFVNIIICVYGIMHVCEKKITETSNETKLMYCTI
jgi:hypothetical protein